jgi:methionyl-tRNA formyltransferase
MGTPDFAVPSLQAIIASNHHLVAVVTVPDAKSGRGRKTKASPVKTEALRHNIPVLQPDNLKDEAFLLELAGFEADIFVVVAFRILPPAVFELAPVGAFNLHASLLPDLRGAAPIQRAIMAGRTLTGNTTFLLQKSVDTGNILMQQSLPITAEMTGGELHDALMISGADLVLRTIDGLAENTFIPQPQDDSKASRAPKIFTEDCVVNWAEPADKVFNLVRALDPYPGAFTELGNKRIKLFSAAPGGNTALAPGSIRYDEKTIWVACGNNREVAFREIQLQGKRRMPVSEYLKGSRFDAGAKFA